MKWQVLNKLRDTITMFINICPNDTSGEVTEIGGVDIQLPKIPPKEEILGYERKPHLQMWRRLPVPEELQRIRSMDEWYEMQSEFKKKFSPYIEKEFDRRRNGLWFYNNGEPVYITGRTLYDVTVVKAGYWLWLLLRISSKTIYSFCSM